MALLNGCGGSGDSPSSSPDAPGTSDSSVPQTNTPASFAGKSYSFTVTARQGLSEPVGATYTITFDQSSYTFYPSPQNDEGKTTPFTSTYSYDPNTATAVLDGAETITATFNFTAPTSGTYHLMEVDGEMQDGNFSQL